MTIIQDLINNSPEFKDYIITKKLYTSIGVTIKEWSSNFKINDEYRDILFIYYEDIFRFYESNKFTTLDELKDRVVGFFCIKKRYRDDEYERIRKNFEIVNKTVLFGSDGPKYNAIVIAADVNELYNSLNPLVDDQRVEGFDFTPSSGAEMKSNTNGEILLVSPPTTPPGFVGQPATGFVFEFTEGNINKEYPDRIKPLKINEKLIEPKPNKSPYKTIKQQKEESIILLSEQNKSKIVKAFNSSIENKKNECFEELRAAAKSYNDLYNNIVSKLDFNVLGSLMLSQINAFIEGNENELICSTEQIKDLLLCPVLTDPFNLPDLGKSKTNTPSIWSGPNSSEINSSISFPSIDINFDFFQTIREMIEDKIVEYVIRLLNEILDNVFEIMDCSEINKFLIKCKNTIDLRANSFLDTTDLTKFFNDTSTETFSNIQSQLNQFDINIDLQQYLAVVKKIFSSFNLSQIQSIVNGIFSGQLYKLLKNLIKSILGDRIEEDKYVAILKIIEETTDSSILNDNTNTIHNDCIHFMPYDYIKANLMSNGYNEEEANQKIDEEKRNKTNSGKLLCSLLRKSLDNFDSNQFISKKSDITKYAIEKSIDHIYDSIGNHRYLHIRTVLNNILIKTFGDMCVAAWKTFSPNNLSTEINDKFKEKFGPPSILSLDFYLNFFENQTYVQKYELTSVNNLVEKFELKREGDNVSFGMNQNDYFYFKLYQNQLYFKDFEGSEYIINNQESDFEISRSNSMKNFFIEKLFWLDPLHNNLSNGIKSSNIDEIAFYNKLYTQYNRKYSDLMASFFSQELIKDDNIELKDTKKFKLSMLELFQVEKGRKNTKEKLLND